MNKDLKVKIGSTVYDRIATARMSEHERRTALHAMRTAEDIVDLCAWIGRKVEQIGSRLFFRPSLKH